MRKEIFFRNDDVRDVLDQSLIDITELFIKHEIPISHAVEPANVSDEVVSWLLLMKENHPDLIEIIQHGYSHRLNYENIIGGKLKKGEFGGNRTYSEQFDEIVKGKQRMDKLFGNLWFPLFTFPYGARNNDAIKAVNDVGFLAVNGSMGVSLKHKYFYTLGRLLNKELLRGRKVSWHLRKKPRTNLFQIDTSISVIDKFIDEVDKCEYQSIEAIKNKSNNYMKNTNVIGYVLHHRYDNQDTISLLDELLSWLKANKSLSFVKQEEIYRKYAK